jgi:hypothetical protein
MKVRAQLQHDLAESLNQTVLPVFIDDEKGRPEHWGSCVLVRLDGRHYAFTAGHVVKAVGSSHLWAAAENGKVEPLPYAKLYRRGADGDELGDIDMGIVPLKSGSLGPFARCRFLDDVDAEDKVEHRWSVNFYFVTGYPVSRSQSRIDHRSKRIDVKLFHLATNPPRGDPYEKELLSRAEHLVMEFDHKDTVVEGEKVNPPNLQGVSGGGIFCISRSSNTGPLVAIATEHRKSSRILVGTRVKHFVNFARELAAAQPPEIFE